MARKSSSRSESSKSKAPTTTAGEIMTTDLINATEGMTVEEALKMLVNNRVTGLPVVDKSGKMTGVLSEYDILQQLAHASSITGEVFQEPIEFTRKGFAISVDTPLQEIVREFIDRKFRRLPVIDHGGNLVGIITRRDLMRVFYYRSRLGGSGE